MKPLLIGLAGGSGCGKSTVAATLYGKYPEKVGIVHVDDYFKRTADAPREHEMVNWDSPEALRFDDLYADITALLNGQSITILTKSEIYHPDYDHALKNKLEYTIEPKPIIVLEGYLALHDDRIRTLMKKKIYLDIPIEQSTQRRSQNKFQLDNEYLHKILIPMHQKFVEPTKKFADLIIDVSNKNKEQVFDEVEKYIGI